MSKRLEDVQTDKVSLEVYECACGFHLGLDATYLEQVSNVRIKCPSCGNLIVSEDEETETTNEGESE
jgi:predicted RNA-binding Zn-ribbon protein involved in translation (DUF1610 family)